MTSRKAIWLLGATVLLTVSACGRPDSQPVVVSTAPTPILGDVPGHLSLEEPQLMTLREMQELSRPANVEAEQGDRLRASALREAALSFGARGGLAWGSREINRRLMARASELSRTFDFNAILIRDRRGAILLPPVVSESRDTMERMEEGRVLRVADLYYEIIAPAGFVPTAPLWHGYLLRTYAAPEMPPFELLPRTDAEREVWRRSVAEGWEAGLRQAEDIFQEDSRRLERDYQGMLRYAALLRENRISAPYVAAASHGVTGTAEAVRVNDRTFRITSDAALSRDPRAWRASPSRLSPAEAAGSR
jgi:defect-in-organelle-trafficking protein DotC